ncbi:hypothetical protein HII31_00917 [Pseudocercospora fuligena]|uniref:Uncharacterized protein n=1 Tax=Pseudocercospora fuligena TaxID=685502 RepID=A0A8H6RVU8_9PEZI|nr:hypothetical protein HII31_00917 [Pseudocercospora fuligena]
MVGLLADMTAPVEANCAICGAPPFPECPHEGERLELALSQAMERWAGLNAIREWVLNHARNQIISTFNQLRAMRMETHRNYLESLPYYTLYRRFNGQPPLQPAQVQLIHSQIHQANNALQQGVDQDWRTSCMRYPEVLDYYFGLIGFEFPSERDTRIVDPRFGAPKEFGTRKIRERRDSVDFRDPPRERRRERRRSRGGGGTPPPAPLPPSFRR